MNFPFPLRRKSFVWHSMIRPRHIELCLLWACVQKIFVLTKTFKRNTLTYVSSKSDLQSTLSFNFNNNTFYPLFSKGVQKIWYIFLFTQCLNISKYHMTWNALVSLYSVQSLQSVFDLHIFIIVLLSNTNFQLKIDRNVNFPYFVS